MDVFQYVLVIFLMLLYICAFCFFYLNKFQEQVKLRRFHCAIKSIVSDNKSSIEEIYDRSMMNYNKIYQGLSSKKQTSYLDILEQILFRYDAYTDANFKSVFHEKKNENVRTMCLILHTYVTEKTPFSNLPTKEATLLNNISEALVHGNVELGEMVLQQLSEEIMNKEFRLKKQEKTNTIATLLSVVGLLFTIFFGIFSIY